MNSLSQITALFAQLASHLQTGSLPNPLFSSVSSLNQSLNLNEDQSRVTGLLPEWFFFASVLLFSKKDCQSIFWAACISGTAKVEETHDIEQYSIAAARYLAYSIIPMSESHSDMLVKSLIQISESWSVKVCSTHKRHPTSGGKKNIRKPRPRDNKNDTMVDEEESTLLLHYAATGEILQLTEAQNVESTHVVKKLKSTEGDLAGARLVFDLYDAVENMSASIFDSDESRMNFLSQLKAKAVSFMVKCVRSLLQVTIDEDGCKMLALLDLH
ncbi:hypothetical protein FRX31_009093 [Thalictrum thalictroides]|uniref:Uncharacterized protein n=1 Tax=Thalictrum thalictroides TaxID=46969 RepID=A0A7J6WV67_THATH|nr:hypothetical protein FRX31_009093 [Thalictrum thalictroides]